MVLKNVDAILLCAVKREKLKNKEKKSVSKIASEREVWQRLYHVIKERNKMRGYGLFCGKEKIGFSSRNFVYCWLSAGEQLLCLSALLQVFFHPYLFNACNAPLSVFIALCWPICCRMHPSLIVGLIVC